MSIGRYAHENCVLCSDQLSVTQVILSERNVQDCASSLALWLEDERYLC